MKRPRPAEGGAVFRAQDLTVRFGETLALDRVTFQVKQGEFVGVLGPNGAGKSTLVRALLGLVQPTEGAVEAFGGPPGAPKARRRIGFVPQKAARADERLFPATAEEIAALGRVPRRGLFRGLSAEDRQRTGEMLHVVGMAGHARRRFGELSGGQRQRVLLAKALAAEPEVLVLDEPTTGVDPAARESFFQLLDHLNHDDGLTVLLVSHDTQALLSSAHRVLAVNRRLVRDGPAEALATPQGLEQVYGMAISHEHGGHEPHVARP